MWAEEFYGAVTTSRFIGASKARRRFWVRNGISASSIAACKSSTKALKWTSLDLDSGIQRPGEWLEVEFAKKGVYNLRCDIHPKMKLMVTVE